MCKIGLHNVMYIENINNKFSLMWPRLKLGYNSKLKHNLQESKLKNCCNIFSDGRY